MIASVQNWLKPKATDPESAFREGVLRALLLLMGGFMLVGLALALIADSSDPRSLVTARRNQVLVGLLIVGLSVLATRRGHSQLAAIALIVMTISIMTLSFWRVGYWAAISAIEAMAALTLALLLLPPRLLWPFLIALIVIINSAIVAHSLGIAPAQIPVEYGEPDIFDPLWWDLLAILVYTAFIGVSAIAFLAYRHALNERNDRLHELVTTLEQRVVERTENLSALNTRLAEEIERRIIIQHQEADQRRFLENAADIFSRLSLEGRYLYVSPSMTRMLGFSSDEIVGRLLSELDIIHPDDNQRIMMDTQASSPADIDDSLRVTLRMRHKDGHYLWVEIITSFIRDPETDVPLEIIAVGRDVTERINFRTELEQRVRLRTRDITAAAQISREIVATLDLETLVRRVVRLTHRRFGVDAVAVFLYDRRRKALLAQGHDPVSLQDDANLIAQVARELQADSRCESGEMAIPMTVQGELIGVFHVQRACEERFSEDDWLVMMLVADQLAIAVNNAYLYQQARSMARVEERQHLARELHDSVSQTLFAASSMADLLPRVMEQKPERLPHYADQLRQMTRGALAQMRTLLVELRPDALTKTDLGVLLNQLSQAHTGNTGLPVTCTVDGTFVLPEAQQIAYYRIAQEALNNITRHADAQQVTLGLSRSGGLVCLTISDDGRGFNPDDIPADHFGLRIMQERALAIGALLDVQSQPGRGTTITLKGSPT